MSCSADKWPSEGLRWVVEPRKDAPGLDGLLSWAYDAGASRVAFTTGHPVWLRVHGINWQATEQSLDEMEIAAIANGSMQTRGVHYDAMQSDALEDAFRTRYSGFCPANGDEATAAIAQ